MHAQQILSYTRVFEPCRIVQAAGASNLLSGWGQASIDCQGQRAGGGAFNSQAQQAREIALDGTAVASGGLLAVAAP